MEEDPSDMSSDPEQPSAAAITILDTSYSDSELSSSEAMPRMNFSSFDGKMHARTVNFNSHSMVESKLSSTEGDDSCTSLSTSGFCYNRSEETRSMLLENQVYKNPELLSINRTALQESQFHQPKIDHDVNVPLEGTSSLEIENTDSKSSSLDLCSFDKMSAENYLVTSLQPPLMNSLRSSESSLDKTESFDKDTSFELGIGNEKELDIVSRQQHGDSSLVSGGTEKDDSEFDDNSDEEDLEYLSNEEGLVDREDNKEIGRAGELKHTEHVEVSVEKGSGNEEDIPDIFDLKDDSLGKPSFEFEKSVNGWYFLLQVLDVC